MTKNALSGDEVEQLHHWFTHHKPDDEKVGKYEILRSSAHSLAVLFFELAPRCADRSAAIRHLRDAVMSVNAAIACDGK